MHSLILRRAKSEDGPRLLTWRNDPVVVAMSKSQAPVEEREHQRWMEFNVSQGYPDHIVLIAESDFVPVGVIRFDVLKTDVMSYRVSISVGAEHRGRGFGQQILDSACDAMTDSTLYAEVDRDNVASCKIFERSGFVPIDNKGRFTVLRRMAA